MLRASHRVLKAGGRLAFVVIAVPEDLPAAARATASELGPDHVDGDAYPSLVSHAGFVDCDVTDVSHEYADTLLAWIREWEVERDGLTSVMSRDEFEDWQARRRRALGAIRRGLLRRYLVAASRP